MDSLIFAINAVTPLIALVALGYFLKRIGWINGDLSQKLNRLVFHVFLPVTLFLNVYRIENLGSIDFGYVLYATVALAVLFLLGFVTVLFFVPERRQRGAIWQATFRSNYALIGIPLAEALFGDEGVIAATLLSAIIVPSLNALAVVSLSLFREGEEKASVKKVLVGIVKNPLIQAIALGLAALLVRSILIRNGIAFRISDIKPIDKTLSYLSGLSTPLALLALGAQFEFSAVASLKKQIIMGVFMRTVLAPVLGIGVAYLFFRDTFNGAHFASLVAVFSTPVSVSSVPMTQEMDGDATLMGQLVVWTTLFSAASIFIVSFLLRLAGIF